MSDRWRWRCGSCDALFHGEPSFRPCPYCGQRPSAQVVARWSLRAGWLMVVFTTGFLVGWAWGFYGP